MILIAFDSARRALSNELQFDCKSFKYKNIKIHLLFTSAQNEIGTKNSDSIQSFFEIYNPLDLKHKIVFTTLFG